MATVDFSFTEQAEIPKANTLSEVSAMKPNRSRCPKAARECQKNPQSGASRFPTNQAAQTGPSQVIVNKPNAAQNFPST